ncbi:MAG: hypothetical protein MJZ64_04190 [Paludibacteraceae bacterium]|nr:hypothetical protein [Paludibacteraceae bacterium]
MMDLILVILLALVGVILLLLELFLLPGFGVAGISGFASFVGAVYVAYAHLGANAGHITLAACIALSALAIYGFLRSHALEKMALDTTIDGKVDLAAPGKKLENLEADAERLEKKS